MNQGPPDLKSSAPNNLAMLVSFQSTSGVNITQETAGKSFLTNEICRIRADHLFLLDFKKLNKVPTL